MTRDHMVHRFQFNGVNLEAAWSSINQTSEFTFSVFPHPTETSLPLRDETLSKTEFTLDEVTLTLFKESCFMVNDFGIR
jgi:hypothetical protein